MSLNLPAPIDQALLHQRVQEWADALVANYNARGRRTAEESGWGVTVDRLVKYWKIVITQDGDSRSVHAFLDPATGDVYKAAGWKAPAKGIRYNLLDDASFARMLARLDWAGGYLYVR